MFLVMILWQPARSALHDENAYVTVTIALSDSLVRPGDSTFVIVRFTPASGISLNADPPPVILLPFSSWYLSDSSLVVPVDSQTGHLDTAQPLEKAVRILKNGQKRQHSLTGTLRYFYCSDEEGWCTRSTVDFELPLTIVQ
jgi:hypothetical protein